MRQSSARHEYVHDLVTRAVDIESPRIPLFGNACGVNDGARRVQETKAQEVSDGHALVLQFPAIEDGAMDDGDES